ARAGVAGRVAPDDLEASVDRARGDPIHAAGALASQPHRLVSLEVPEPSGEHGLVRASDSTRAEAVRIDHEVALRAEGDERRAVERVDHLSDSRRACLDDRSALVADLRTAHPLAPLRCDEVPCLA